MYAEAKLQMDREILLNNLLRHNNLNHQQSNLPWSHQLNTTPLRRNDGETLRNLEQQINTRATTLAKSYVASLDDTQRKDEKLSYQKIFLVLKFNETPDHVILEGMK